MVRWVCILMHRRPISGKLSGYWQLYSEFPRQVGSLIFGPDRTLSSHGRGSSCSSRRALWPEIRASSVCISCALSSLAEQSVNPTFPVNTTCDWTVRQQTAKHWPRAEGPPSRLFFKLRVCEASFSLSLSFRVSERSCVTTLPLITWVASSQLCGRISAKWVL